MVETVWVVPWTVETAAGRDHIGGSKNGGDCVGGSKDIGDCVEGSRNFGDCVGGSSHCVAKLVSMKSSGSSPLACGVHTSMWSSHM